uniref:Uncharacterized protein n=1 Tax=Anguilla anguilla TaxID=7936 RepID=A0A0E9TX79_ANGAN
MQKTPSRSVTPLEITEEVTRRSPS